MEPRFNKGDRVKIKDSLSGCMGYVPSMDLYAGRYSNISTVRSKCYNLENCGDWNFSEEMFVKYPTLSVDSRFMVGDVEYIVRQDSKKTFWAENWENEEDCLVEDVFPIGERATFMQNVLGYVNPNYRCNSLNDLSLLVHEVQIEHNKISLLNQEEVDYPTLSIGQQILWGDVVMYVSERGSILVNMNGDNRYPFTILEIDSKSFCISILGYYFGGKFPSCENIKDLSKLVYALQREWVKKFGGWPDKNSVDPRVVGRRAKQNLREDSNVKLKFGLVYEPIEINKPIYCERKPFILKENIEKESKMVYIRFKDDIPF